MRHLQREFCLVTALSHEGRAFRDVSKRKHVPTKFEI